MATKKSFELIGIGMPTKQNTPYCGVPVTYMCAGNLTTVYVFGFHPSDVFDRDDDDCEVVQNRELAKCAIEAVESIWQWFNQQRDETVASYVFEKRQQEQREKRTMANGQPSLAEPRQGKTQSRTVAESARTDLFSSPKEQQVHKVTIEELVEQCGKDID